MREMDENRGAPACEMNRFPFRWLNVSQFLGALNDNILKLLIILFIISQQGSDHAAQIGALASVVFVVPFLLFSATAGILADRFSKGRLIVIIKGMEVLVTLLALTAFWSGSEKFLYLALFLMASHSALFAPAKYGIVPELVPRHELSRANGLLEMLTYLAIGAGAGLAPLRAQLAGGRHAVAAGVCVFIALAGLGASLRLPATPVA
ncbi:MAG TPA: MFS transporter, partial [Geobacterales bacterium]|nr:MFS transporter [Geobacterales bacterium]